MELATTSQNPMCTLCDQVLKTSERGGGREGGMGWDGIRFFVSSSWVTCDNVLPDKK